MSEQASDYFKRVYPHSPSELAKQLAFYVLTSGWKHERPGTKKARKALSSYGYQIQYVVQGLGFLEWRGKTYKMEAGDIFFLDLSEEHAYYADKLNPWEVIWIHYNGPQADTYGKLLDSFAPVFRLEGQLNAAPSFRQLIQLFAQRPIGLEVNASYLIMRILTLLVLYVMESGGNDSQSNVRNHTATIHKAVSFIQREYASSIKLEDVAKEVSLSPFHFSRLFKQITGFSFKEFIIKHRIRMAKEMLIHTDLTVGEIAYRIGFADHAYFSRIFRKYEQVTPYRYRSHSMDRF